MKVIHTAAVIIGAVAAVASVILPFTPFAPLAPIARLVAVGAGLVAAVTASKQPKGTATGSPTDFKADPQAPIPYIVGRSYQAGYIVHRDTFGTKGAFQSFVIVWSLGLIQAYDGFLVDNVTTTFSGGSAVGAYSGWMWLDTQLGASPESVALPSSRGTLPGWSSTSKLSGLAAGLWTIKFDTNGVKYAGGVPQFGAVIKGPQVYDPRLDSTYPGGSGSCRALNESTYVWSENPWLHALTFAIGRWQNGKRVLGVGMPIDTIDVAAFVEAANISDANGWKIGGTVSSADDKWNVLKMMAQAGGGECMQLGARLSCIVATPRVSLATITSADVVGRASVTATQKRRDRINGVVPRIRSEAAGWVVVPLDVVRGSTYLTEDGQERTKEVDYQLVQGINQGAQLAAYEVANSREFSPISLPLKPVWLGYKPGDCLTCNIPELGLNGQTCIQLNRTLDPASGIVTIEMRSETTAKHAWALGQTGTAPPTPTLGAPDFPTINANYETVPQAELLIASSTTDPTRVLSASESGGVASITILAHNRIYRDGRTIAIPSTTIGGLLTDTPYFLYYDDITRSNTAPTVIASTDPASQVVSGVGRHTLGRTRTPVTASGITYVGGGSYPTGRTLGGEVP